MDRNKINVQLDILSNSFTADELEELGNKLIEKAKSKRNSYSSSSKSYERSSSSSSYESSSSSSDDFDYYGSALFWADPLG